VDCAILTEFGFTIDGPSVLCTDNKSSLAVSKNPEHHGCMKHLDLRFFWLRDQVTSGVIKTVYIPTESMHADLLTKALPRVKVETFRRMMGLEG
jgi:hypothetical protein